MLWRKKKTRSWCYSTIC